MPSKIPSASRGRYHHGHLPRALIEASWELVAAHGVQNFSLREAARQAGVDPAAVYRHFQDRSELLGAVALAGFSQLSTAMAEDIAATNTPAEHFAAIGTAYVHFAVSNPECFRVMFGPYGRGSEGSLAKRGTAGTSAYDHLTTALGELAAQSPLALDVPAAAVVAWSSVHGLSTLLVDNALELTGEALEQAIADVTQSIIRSLLRTSEQ